MVKPAERQARIRVGAIRWQGKRENGAPNGAILTGRVLDRQGNETGEALVCVFPGNLLPVGTEVAIGDIWDVCGRPEMYKGNPQLRCTLAALARPTGANFIRVLSSGSRFTGIGPALANQLWTRFGEEIFEILERGDLKRLEAILAADVAQNLVEQWKDFAVTDVVRWLDRHRMNPRLGMKIVGYYGSEAIAKLNLDPYRLLAFDSNWRRVDKLAREGFGVSDDDPRRMHAAATEALYQELDRQNTAASAATLFAATQRLLGSSDLARGALNETYTDGGFVENGDLYQARGAYLMERFIAGVVQERLTARAQLDLLQQDVVISQAIAEFEREVHPLGEEQRQAVRLAMASRIAVITGGAGVGKTSVLKAVYRSVAASKGKVLQMALSGRAAKRMREATGLPAMTIAGFLHSVTESDLAQYTHLVIDEASMLDVPSAFRIFRRVPEHLNVILVGDAFQLPPIGPGLVFHLLADLSGMPVARLTKVYRQSGTSGIPTFSQSVRNGNWPDLPRFDGRGQGVSFVPADADGMAEAIDWLYRELGGSDPEQDVQVLCATKADKPWGTTGINRLLHEIYAAGQPEVYTVDGDGQVVLTGISVGDPVIYTKNDWDRSIFNGSLGRVVSCNEVAPGGSAVAHDAPVPVCTVDFDGLQVHLSSEDMELLDLAYAITVHKAQGSQFRRVIVPVSHSKLLDRTLIYTAITRGVEQVVLVGDVDAAKRATVAAPFALKREIGLRYLLAASRPTL